MPWKITKRRETESKSGETKRRMNVSYFLSTITEFFAFFLNLFLLWRSLYLRWIPLKHLEQMSWFFIFNKMKVMKIKIMWTICLSLFDFHCFCLFLSMVYSPWYLKSDSQKSVYFASYEWLHFSENVEKKVHRQPTTIQANALDFLKK